VAAAATSGFNFADQYRRPGKGTVRANIGSLGQVDRALHDTGAGSAAQRVGLKGTSWREQDVPDSCRENNILVIN
jgi:hypothetical protein